MDIFCGKYIEAGFHRKPAGFRPKNCRQFFGLALIWSEDFFWLFMAKKNPHLITFLKIEYPFFLSTPTKYFIDSPSPFSATALGWGGFPIKYLAGKKKEYSIFKKYNGQYIFFMSACLFTFFQKKI
jgi:hypothetical protein